MARCYPIAANAETDFAKFKRLNEEKKVRERVDAEEVAASSLMGSRLGDRIVVPFALQISMSWGWGADGLLGMFARASCRRFG